ncbi:MAG: DUF5106 domain-containing protein [Bacteroidales bacterium]|nr:DUF5106 domain-containing protein [Bacteroidales bacterium]
MKAPLPLLLLLGLALGAAAQPYAITFRLEGATDSMLYLGRHYRDQVQLLDSTRRTSKGSYLFQGRRAWPRGVYALVGQDRKTVVGDVAIDGSQRFTLTADAKLTPSTVKVKGSPANSRMFAYRAAMETAREESEALRQRRKDPALKAQAEKEEEAFIRRMTEYDRTARREGSGTLYFTLLDLLDDPEVPDSVQNKPVYFRDHFWDRLFPPQGTGHSAAVSTDELRYSHQFYSRMNYFFYGLLYYAPSDTICKEIDRLAARIGDDTALLRYVFDHIEPRYFRSTKNIGWDAVWCHLASQYYLQGRCPWASEGTLHNMRYNYDRLKQSLIGAHGQELWMADTNQSADPKDWVSSHRFPTRYVVLWFWDPDCHHCQEQSAELAALCDSLRSAPDPRLTVYAVGYEENVDKWKRYLREHHMPFVNVGGTNVNIDYQEAYNVHSAPTMIILNERRDIIMNKTLPVKNLMRFLDEYERQHP